MYIGISKEKFVQSEDIIGIFDLDITSQSYLTRKYLSLSEKSGKIVNTAEDIPRSFIVCADGKTYLSQMSSLTLVKHTEQKII